MGALGASLTLALLALGGAAAVMIPDDLPGIIAVDFSLSNTNPGKSPTSNTIWRLRVNVQNFNPVVGFAINLYFKSFDNTDIVVLGFEDPMFQVSFSPNSTSYQNNTIQGGALNEIAGFFSGPILGQSNCALPNMAPFLPPCTEFTAETLLEVLFMTPEPAIADDIIIGGPLPEVEEPLFAVSALFLPIIEEDTPTPTPVPSPIAAPEPAPEPTPVPSDPVPPAPSPVSARSVSDPHMVGFLGQEFEFTGKPGTIYNLITENADGAPSMVLNALFGVAYTSGFSTDSDTMEIKPFRTHGTWVREVGLQVWDTQLQLSAEDSLVMCNSPSSCLSYGSVLLNDNEVVRLGLYEMGAMNVTLSNSRSYSKVIVESQDLDVQFDVVPPSSAWSIPAQDMWEYSHLNIVFGKVRLADSQGVLGETAFLRYDSKGNPVMKGKGMNGEGVLRYGSATYAVNSLFTPLR